MKRKALIIGALIAVLCMGIAGNADAQRRGYHRGYGYGYRHGYGYRPHRVWVAPPPPIVIVGPRYGYHRPHYVRPRYHREYYGRPYAYRGRPSRRW